MKTLSVRIFSASMLLASLLMCFAVLSSCDMTNSTMSGGGITATSGNVTIAQIFETAKLTSGYTWYKKSDALLGRTAKSGHTEPFMRTRYNSVAAQMLDASGKVKDGSVFAEGSIITKELINADRTTVNGYALLIKRKADPNADADGWVWGYVSGTGTERHPLTSKGNGCIGCHSIAGHIDRTLMNVSVP